MSFFEKQKRESFFVRNFLSLFIKMSSTPCQIPSIVKLKGRENYMDWAFAVEAYLKHEGLWKTVQGTDEEEDAGKKEERNEKAISKIVLLIEPSNYNHVRGHATAKAVWKSLEQTFEDSGMYRRVGLIRQLTSTKLDDCSDIEEYVNKIMSAAHKLIQIDKNGVSDSWVVTFLLAGLSSRYDPMIMALESSSVPLTSDAIKTKLLQDVKPNESSNMKAFFSKGNRRRGKQNYTTPQSSQTPLHAPQSSQVLPSLQTTHNKQFNTRCYACQEIGHISKFCPKKKKYAMTAAVVRSDQSFLNNLFCANASGYYGGCGISQGNDEWIIDSGASYAMTGREDWFHETGAPIINEILVANNAKLNVKSTGKVLMNVDCEGEVKTVPVSNVLHVPDLSVNLLSVSQIVLKDYKVIFDKFGCRIYDVNDQLHSTGRHVNNSFIVNLAKSQCNFSMKKVDNTTSELWHRRMAHLNRNDLLKLKNGLASGISFNDQPNQSTSSCVPCLQGKQTRRPFPKKGSRATSVMELIHSDLCGPMEVRSISGAKYFLTLIDDLSRKVFVYFLKTKEHVKQIFEEFKVLYERQLSKIIKILRSDNGGEFIISELEEYLRRSGIIHQTSNPSTPEQNGLAERMNLTLVEKARCMLQDAGLPKMFWAEAVATAAYLANRSRRDTKKHQKKFGVV